jgi:hypothetical protein
MTAAPKKPRRAVKVLAVLGGLVVIIAAIAALGPDEDKPDGAQAPPAASGGGDGDSSGVSPTPPPPPPSPPPPAPEPEGFGNGIWRVGEDIEPGLYYAPARSGCYWARLSGFSGDLDDIEANEVGSHRMIVEILTSDAGFESRGCGRWIALEDQLNATAAERPYTQIDNGFWKVGDEVLPGLYYAPARSSCYWARLSGFSGGSGAIEANELGGHRMIVEILATDVGFESRGCGKWIPLESHLSATAADRPYSEIGDGFWKVGDEIQPGQWRTEGGSLCYWARLSGFSGGSGDLEANGLPDGPAIVTIQAQDIGFKTSGCGTWERLD